MVRCPRILRAYSTTLTLLGKEPTGAVTVLTMYFGQPHDHVMVQHGTDYLLCGKSHAVLHRLHVSTHETLSDCPQA